MSLPDVISVIQREIDFISVDIHLENNQLKEVFIRYSAQIKLNKMRVTHEINSVFSKQSSFF